MNGPEAQYEDYTLEYEDIFNGPIFLLVELVQKKKIDIYDISLSYIINGFMEFIKEKSGVLLDTISSFTYFSSILLEIKSRSLLPSKKTDEGEEGELDVNILKRREEEYRIYQGSTDGKRLFRYFSGVYKKNRIGRLMAVCVQAACKK